MLARGGNIYLTTKQDKVQYIRAREGNYSKAERAFPSENYKIATWLHGKRHYCI